jgi:hypothetical protein
MNITIEDLVRALDIMQEHKKISATMLQRYLWKWFAYCAKILDMLESNW